MTVTENWFRRFPVFCVVTLAIAGPACLAATGDRPSIVPILADDMGYGDCTVNNPESKISTPNIDQLAGEGLRYTDAHSPSSTCTPSRYGLLTGINPERTGVSNTLLKTGNPMIDEGRPTLASLLKAQGYSTAMIGKWHLGFQMDMSGNRAEFDFSKPLVGGPTDRGFETFYGIPASLDGSPYFYIENNRPVELPTASTPGSQSDPATISMRAQGAFWHQGAMAPGFPSLTESLIQTPINGQRIRRGLG